MTRVIVYIDGFNLYHAIDDLKEPSLKWVDLWALSETMLRGNQALAAVKYFSVYATWLPGAYARHRKYVAALETRGVTPILGRFKEKHVKCLATCRETFVSHEEKETDVAIGAHLIADTLRERFDTAFVVSADTDLNAAIKIARAEAPRKKIHVVAPPGRFSRNRELRPLFELTKGKVRRSLLPDEVATASGEIIKRPPSYQ